MDFLEAFSAVLDVANTNQITQKQRPDHAKDIPRRQKKCYPTMSENHKKQTKKHAALQPLQGSHQGESCIQPPGVKENSLDIEAQPWEAQAAAPLLLLSPPQQKKNPQKRFMIGGLFDLCACQRTNPDFKFWLLFQPRVLPHKAWRCSRLF